MKLEVFNIPDDALRALTARLVKSMSGRHSSPFHLALSGGETAKQLFKIWVDEYHEKINWDQLRFYWVDERCVSPDDEESNFKHADELLFHPLNIPADHIHRIFGESDPEAEAIRYSDVVKWELPGYACIPRFDCIILGIGGDGHTASIFPDVPELLEAEQCYVVSAHPETGQKRITMTGTLILKGKMILIPVLGESKTQVLQKVIHSSSESLLPAGYIVSHFPEAVIYTDSKISLE